MKLLVATSPPPVRRRRCLGSRWPAPDAELELCVVIRRAARAGDKRAGDMNTNSPTLLDHAAQAWLDDATAMIPDDIETTATIATDANPASPDPAGSEVESRPHRHGRFGRRHPGPAHSGPSSTASCTPPHPGRAGTPGFSAMSVPNRSGNSL